MNCIYCGKPIFVPGRDFFNNGYYAPAHSHCIEAVNNISTERLVEELTYIYFGPDEMTEDNWKKLVSDVKHRDVSNPGR